MKVKLGILFLTGACALVLGALAAGESASRKMEAQSVACFEDKPVRYVLRDYEGFVAVFVENDPDCPMTITDIQVQTLRELDKSLLRTGMKISSHETLVMMLEDLGS